MNFLDLSGVSGAVYRYRRVSLDELPATAGNLVVTAASPTGRRYVLCAAARDLSRARAHLELLLREHHDADLFIRLNVARATREAEHADVVAAVQPTAELSDLA